MKLGTFFVIIVAASLLGLWAKSLLAFCFFVIAFLALDELLADHGRKK